MENLKNYENREYILSETTTTASDSIPFSSQGQISVLPTLKLDELIDHTFPIKKNDLNCSNITEISDNINNLINGQESDSEVLLHLPEFDSSIKFIHDAQKFFMALSIAESELDLVNNSKLLKGNNLDNSEDLIECQSGVNCLKDIRCYVEDLLETVNETRKSTYIFEKYIFECCNLIEGSFNNDLTNRLQDYDKYKDDYNPEYLIICEKLKYLCKKIIDDNNNMREKCKLYEIECNKYYNLDESISNKSNWIRFIFKLIFFIIFFISLPLLNKFLGLEENRYKEKMDNLQNMNNIIFNKAKNMKNYVETLSEFDLHGSSICTILSELDIIEKCFTRIRFS
ncbi:uncharacterized protein CMU_003630 [Cryptosporidium muris RN66]|uniref:Uncharacterized protein n=1 Tax=Cryptosporidium muris (strain RN66) TaxID=441375 RepID=B6AJY3_CRYMR|nr:uncharacterized protein CMU_003630 [Cryptosporidium muris RN66]EEA08524.1 hypothetical protein, conserved [Cryptosporidium muris RN66]|eukprot:XP_002142873.1 hypothetical protein [Cryptosporidium muris RN66]